MKTICFFFFLLYSLLANSQNTFHELVNDSLGGRLTIMRKTNDGGQIMAGDQLGMGYYLFSKTDSNGSLSFCKLLSFGINDIISTSSGYLLLKSVGGIAFIKADQSGNFISGSAYTTTPWFGGISFFQKPDGSILLGGIGSNSMAVAKFDSTGTVIWNKKYSSNYFRQMEKIIDYGNENFYLFGSVYDSSSTFNKAFVAKFDTSGNLLWNRYYNLKVYNLLSADLTNDNGFILCSSFFENQEFVTGLMKIDSSGNVLWNKIYSDSGKYVEGIDVKTVHDQGYIITGNYGINPFLHPFLIRTDISGNIDWSYKYGGTHSEIICNVCTTLDNGFAFAGSTNGFSSSIVHTTGYLAKTDSLGKIGCYEQSITIDTSSMLINESTLLFTTSTTTFTPGQITLPNPINDYGSFVCSSVNIDSPEEGIRCKIYPNPSNDKIILGLDDSNVESLSLNIYNSLGVKMMKIINLESENLLDISKYPDGIYFYSINNLKNNFTGSFVVLH